MNAVVPFPSPANHFAEIWDLGYRSIVPVIPPQVPISDRSEIAKRIRTGAGDPRGKTPGVKYADGAWGGLPGWHTYQATTDDLLRWQAMGASVGVRTGPLGDGTTLVLIDADTMDLEHARRIRDIVTAHCGVLPIRVGRYPKAGYLVRVEGEFQYTLLPFNKTERVELLAGRKQFVASGVHPGTMQNYQWPKGMPALDDVPRVSTQTIDDMLQAMRASLPEPERVQTVGDAANVDQARLRGDPEKLTAAIAALPNTTATFGTREQWLEMGYAVKAAFGPDREAEALDVFQDWSARWIDPPDDAGNDPEYVANEWARMKGPFRVGAEKIYRLAAEHSGGAWGVGELWFEEPVEAPEPLFPVEPATARTFEVLSIDDVFDRPDPRFLIDRHVPEESVGFLYGAPGTGKSFIALDWALHLAFGKPAWHGDRVLTDEDAGRGKVIYIASEGASGFKTRIAAWMKAHGVTSAAGASFGLVHETIDFMKAEDVERLLMTVNAARNGGRAAMVVVDTVSRAMPGADENLQKDMTLFVAACGKVSRRFGCAVIGVHHSNKSGEMRGSTVLLGAGDFVFKLDRKKGATVGRLECEKQKDAPDGWSDTYRFDVVALAPLEGADGRWTERSSLVVTRCEAAELGSGEALTPEKADSVLAALQAAWDAGKPWGLNYRCGDRMAARVMVREHGFGLDEATNAMTVWIGSGMIVEDVASGKTKARGLRLASNKKEIGETDLFD